MQRHVLLQRMRAGFMEPVGVSSAQCRALSGGGGLQLSRQTTLLCPHRPDNALDNSCNDDGRALTNRTAAARPPCAAPAVTAQTARTGGQEGQRFRLQAAVKVIPHPDKVSYGGEDAYFISTVGGGSIGVADGVGGWAESGVNSAEYSKTFMDTARAYVEDNAEKDTRASNGILDSKAPLAAAHEKTRLPGSTTACVLRLDPSSGRLCATNLGDSGFLVCRGDEVVLRSKAQQHFFDCPLQFAACPEYVEETDTVEDADMFDLPLEFGDIVVAATDGVWDNIYDADIVSLVKQDSFSLEDMASSIAELAYKNSLDTKYLSPYIMEARKQGIELPLWERLLGAQLKGGWFKLKEPEGGKRDDITTVVARVEPSDGSAAPPARPSSSNDAAKAKGGSGNGAKESDNGEAAGNGDDVLSKEGKTNLAVDLVEGSIGFVHATEVT